jgi:phospholipase C
MPEQEAGRRRARPLPYQPDAQATLGQNTVRLELSNSGSESVHFALYPYAQEFANPVHFDVTRQTEHTVPVQGAYDLLLLGPNGFRREFAGDVRGKAQVSSLVRGFSPVLTLRLQNLGDKTLTFVIGRRRIVVKPGGRSAIPWLTGMNSGWYDLTAVMNSGWYDLTATVIEEPGFRRRLAGHIEDGKEPISG